MSKSINYGAVICNIINNFDQEFWKVRGVRSVFLDPTIRILVHQGINFVYIADGEGIMNQTFPFRFY